MQTLQSSSHLRLGSWRGWSSVDWFSTKQGFCRRLKCMVLRILTTGGLAMMFGRIPWLCWTQLTSDLCRCTSQRLSSFMLGMEKVESGLCCIKQTPEPDLSTCLGSDWSFTNNMLKRRRWGQLQHTMKLGLGTCQCKSCAMMTSSGVRNSWNLHWLSYQKRRNFGVTHIRLMPRFKGRSWRKINHRQRQPLVSLHRSQQFVREIPIEPEEFTIWWMEHTDQTALDYQLCADFNAGACTTLCKVRGVVWTTLGRISAAGALEHTVCRTALTRSHPRLVGFKATEQRKAKERERKEKRAVDVPPTDSKRTVKFHFRMTPLPTAEISSTVCTEWNWSRSYAVIWISITQWSSI